MEQKVIILSADAWSMKDDATNKELKGVSVFYYPGDSLNPVKNSELSYGNKPLKVTMPYEFIDEIAAAGGCPCLAIAHIVIRNKGGQQVLIPESFEFSKK